MKKKVNNRNLNDTIASDQNKNNLQEYPIYPASEDIYSKCKEEKEINPEDSSGFKDSIHFDEEAINNESDFDDDVSAAIWMFLDQNWMMNRNSLEMKMKRIIIIVSGR